MANCQHCGAEVGPDAGTCPACGRDRTTERGVPRGGTDRQGVSRRTEPENGDRGSSTGQPGATNGPPNAAVGDTSRTSGDGRQRPPSRGTRHRHTAPPGADRPSPEPTGVKLLAGVLGFFGAIQGLLGLWAFDVGGQASAVGARGAGSTMTAVGLLMLCFGVVYVVVAIGLWTFRSWGWSAGVVVLAVGSLGSLVLLAGGARGAGPVFGLLVNIGALGYLVTASDRYSYASRLRHGTT